MNDRADLSRLVARFQAGGSRPAVAEPQSPPQSEGAGTVCQNVQQVVQAGGALSDLLLHPDFKPFERVFRRLPTDSMYTATQSRPAQIEVGAFTVDKTQSLLLAEYGFTIYRYNGAVVNDVVPLEEGRLSLSLGFDLNNLSQLRKGNVAFEIVPTDAPVQDRQAFAGQTTGGTVFGGREASFQQQAAGTLSTIYGAGSTPSQQAPSQQATGSALPRAQQSAFDRARTAVKTSNAGSALQPNRGQDSQGPGRFPFSFVIRETQSVQLRMTVFAPLSVPVAFFEGRLKGYLVPANALDALLEGVKPCW